LLSFGAEYFVLSLLSKYTDIQIYRTIIIPVVLYGGETWSVTFREGLRVKACENRMMRRIFGLKRNKVKGEWRRQQNEELIISSISVTNYEYLTVV
jgi:hypothetical protein